MRLFGISCLILKFLAAPVANALATDIWVSGAGDDDNGTGSESNPYRTITQAPSVAPSGSIVIKVKAGAYTEAVGEVFPLSRPSAVGLTGGITIAGQESAESSYPEIGGDINDSPSSGSRRTP